MFFPDCSTVRGGAPRLVAGTPLLVAGARRCYQALRQRSKMLPCAPKVLSGALRWSQTSHNHSHGTSVPVIRDPSYSEGWQECPPQVWDSPEIDASKFALHILSDTPGGFQWLQYILLMYLSSENIPTMYFIVLYSDSVKSIDSIASSKVSRVNI